MPRLSKGFYLTAPIVALIALLILAIALVRLLVSRSINGIDPGWMFLLVLGAIGAMYSGIVSLVFIYKIWGDIADQYARTTPVKAIGFLFIPFFQLYWVFQVIWGFAKDCNAYMDRHSMNAPKLPEGMFLVCVILQVAAIIPYLGILFALVSLVLFAIVISKTCDTLNAFSQPGLSPVAVIAPTLSLYFVSGEFANDSLDLPAAGLTMGRDPQKSNLIFNSHKVSSAHARLTPTPQGQVLVEDLNSMNGMFYRQQRPGAQAMGSDWVQFHGQMVFDVGTHLRLADGVSEFEIRKQ
jgi:hypothetical protein